MRLALILSLCLGTSLQAQEGIAPGVPKHSVSEDTGLPYWAPGRGVIDYDALRRRELAVIETQFAAFRDTSRAMANAAIAHCDTGADFMPAYRDARLAWAPLEAYQFGPMEQQGAALSINFWPDRKGFMRRALPELLAQPGADLRSPDTVAARSAAVQGFPAIEALIGDDAYPACPAIVGISAYLADRGAALYDGWFGPDGWADLARNAGPDNPIYLTAQEFTKEIYTAMDYLLGRVRDHALTRPLGDVTGPKPNRAEAWQTDLSLPIISAQIRSVRRMVETGFGPDVTEPSVVWVIEVFDQTLARIDKMDMPLTQAVMDADGQWAVDGLRSKMTYLILQMDQDIGPELGVETGFSVADGD